MVPKNINKRHSNGEENTSKKTESGSKKEDKSKRRGTSGSIVLPASPKRDSEENTRRAKKDDSPEISFEEYKKRRLAGESHDDIAASLRSSTKPSRAGLKGQGPSDEDMMRIALAAETGNISFSPYLRNAVSNYEKADNRARQELQGAGLMPDDPRYEEWKDTLIQQYYGDEFIPYDVAAKALGYSNQLNNAAYMRGQDIESDKQVKNFSDLMQQVDPVTGMRYSDLESQKPNFASGSGMSQNLASGLSFVPGANTPNTPAQDDHSDFDYESFARAAGGYGKF